MVGMILQIRKGLYVFSDYWRKSNMRFPFIVCNRCMKFVKPNMKFCPFCSNTLHLVSVELVDLYSYSVPKVIKFRGNQYSNLYRWKAAQRNLNLIRKLKDTRNV